VALLRESLGVLMEGVPSGVDMAALERHVCTTPGVSEVHDLHVWAIAGDVPVVTAHVIVMPGEHGIEIADRVGRRLQQQLPGAHVTVQPEAASAEGLVILRLR